MRLTSTRVLAAILCFNKALAGFCTPSPAFPVPTWDDWTKEEIKTTLQDLEPRLKAIVAQDKFNASSYSVSITSNTAELWSSFHTAVVRNESRKGTTEVDKDSLYRIASITKTFTVLGILKQHAAGNLSLDDPISKYVGGLPQKGAAGLPWKDITLRILGSQLSGIPREFAQSDLLNELPDPTNVGLPPPSNKGLAPCDEYDSYKPCNKSDLLMVLEQQEPLYAPNAKSTYSNVAFELLGLAIENVTGLTYSNYIQQAIFDELDMQSSSLEKPSDKHAVIPNGPNYWDVDEGIQNPTGGIYTSAEDMSKYARYSLTHFNAIATGVNWLLPASWSTGMNSFYGMPFEIFRTDKILPELYAKRPVTFVTKSGGLPGYTSILMILPEYGLGVTILVAGDGELLNELRETITVSLVRSAERIAWQKVQQTYAGDYDAIDKALNSSISFSVSPAAGLHVTTFISNGSDILNYVIPNYLIRNTPFRTQLIPTLLFKDEKKQAGEIFRLLALPVPKPDHVRQVWDDFCITDDDQARYDGRPLGEIVFWHDEGVVELPGWQLKTKQRDDTQFATDDAQAALKFEL